MEKFTDSAQVSWNNESNIEHHWCDMLSFKLNNENNLNSFITDLSLKKITLTTC